MGKTLQIVLVDDNPDDRALVIRQLEKEFSKFNIIQIRDAEGFQQALKISDLDLVITDYQLRWSDGLAVLQEVKSRFPACPVIMFTATGSEEIAVQAMKNGLDDYVLKSPKHFARLQAAVRGVLGRADSFRRAKQLQSQLQNLLERLNVGVFRTTPAGRLLSANPSCLKMLGLKSLQEADQINLSEFYPTPGDRKKLISTLLEKGILQEQETQLCRRDGTPIWVSLTETVYQMGENEVYIEGLMEDITQRKKAEIALIESEERYRRLVELSPEPIGVHCKGKIVYINPAGVKLFGAKSADELIGQPALKFVHPDYHDLAKERMRHLQVDRKLVDLVEEKFIRLDGKVIDAEIIGIPIIYDKKPAVQVVIRDITERKKLEEQLFQSQKMEAIGRLAGGVAHDFNNLLTAITGYSELILQTLKANDPMRDDVKEIKKAADRATGLTRQLLAFSRKQMMQPRILNLNQIIEDMEKMFRRLIGEDIELTTQLSPKLAFVKADPAQIEQVIMNLIVNARDAMPQGGKLLIETANVELDEEYVNTHNEVKAGAYVMLAVSDSGIGMDQDTRGRVFEPFFTTKDVTKGTGLGLSTVYGIVKQSEGNIWVYSEPGKGTTFKIYLPQVQKDVLEKQTIEKPARSLRGNETILVVEDENILRELARRVLRRHGYTVLEAQNSNEALLICEKHDGPVHLLLTDVVLPQINGRELAERLAILRPEMKVVYMSGYTDDAIIGHGLLTMETDFIQKPFTADTLVKKIREVLNKS